MKPVTYGTVDPIFVWAEVDPIEVFVSYHTARALLLTADRLRRP